MMPTEPGLYQYKCAETNNEWEHAAITYLNGALLVHEEGLGKTPLDDFHNNLIDIEWRSIA